MKITSIEIIGYGKWAQKTFAELKDFQMFYGANEAGKSTIMAFIHSILFGFPTKQQSEPRREPKNKGPYGGRITLAETQYGTVTIERLRGKATGDVTIYLESGEIWNEEKLTNILNHIDRSTYEAIFSFNIHGLQQVEQMKQSDFEKYLLVTSATGSDQLLKVNSSLKKQMDQLFKPSGRNPEINRQLERTKAAQASFIAAKKNNANYENYIKEQLQLAKRMEELVIENKELQLKWNDLETLEKNWTLLTEWDSLKRFVNENKGLQFPTDGLIRLEHILTNETARQNEKTQLEERQRALIEQETTRFKMLDHDMLAKLEQAIESWPLIAEKQNRSAELARDIEQIDIELTRIEANYHFLKTDNFVFPKGIEEKAKQIKQQIDELDVAKQKATWQLSLVQQEEEKTQKQIDQLEEEIWSKDKWQQAKEQFGSEKNTQRSARKTAIYLFGGTILTALLLLISFWQASRMFAGFAGMIVIISTWLFYLLGKQKLTGKLTPDMLAFLEQQQKRDAFQKSFAEMDELAYKISQVEEEQKILLARENTLLEGVHAIFAEIGLRHVNPDFLTELQAFKEWLALMRKREMQESKRTELNNEVNNFYKQAQLLAKSFGVTEGNINMQMAELKQQMKQFNNSTAKLAKNEEKKEQLANQLDLVNKSLTTLLNSKQELFARANVNDEELFRECGIKYKEYQTAKDRLQLLETQLSEHKREQFSSYASERDVAEQLLTIRKRLQQNESERSNIQAKQAELTLAIQVLEEGGTYTDLMQTFYNEKARLTEQAQEWFTLKIAQSLLEKALNHLQEEKFPRALALASSYFAILTDNEYKNVRFEGEKIQVIRAADSIPFSPEELSQATKEQLYLAVRFALIESVEANYPFPIIIDDSFVNFDEKRLTQIMQLLKKRQLKNQIIFFTCHKEISQYFSRDEQVMLY